MSELKNDRYLRALLRQPVDRTPIWLMRQAGRYLPEYRALRQQRGSFMALCTNPELACQVTLQPLARYDLDAAIIFSDILIIPDAMGMGLYFKEGEGPAFTSPISSEQEIKKLPIPDPILSLSYVMDAITLTKRELNNRIPLIGFAGSPWTLAAYMLKGANRIESLNTLQQMLISHPASIHLLLEKLAETIILCLNAQIAAGAQAIMIFDTWGGALSTDNFVKFSLHYSRKVMAGLTRHVGGKVIPITLFTKGGSDWLKMMSTSGCDALGIDSTISLHAARQAVKNRVALQGNLDPSILCYATPQQIEQAVQTILASYGNANGHIFNLGHGVDKLTPPENVNILINSVKKASMQYHSHL